YLDRASRHSFPTRRSSDLTMGYVYPGIDNWLRKRGAVRNDGVSDEKNLEKLMLGRIDCMVVAESMVRFYVRQHQLADQVNIEPLDRKSTRLNSSHQIISYA